MGCFILFLRALHLSFGTESWSWLQSAINQPAFVEELPGKEHSSSAGLLVLMEAFKTHLSSVYEEKRKEERGREKQRDTEREREIKDERDFL